MTINYDNIESTVQKYVLGQLSTAEVDEFELYFITRPDIIDLIEVTQQMYLGASHLNENTKKTAVVESESRANQSSTWLDKVRSLLSFPVPAYAFALSLFALAPLMSVMLDGNTGNGIGDGAGINDTPLELVRFTTEVVRSGVEFDEVLNLSEVGDNAAVFIKLKAVDYEFYQAVLLDESDKEVWLSPRFQPSALRDSLILIPNSVERKEVKLQVYGVVESGETQKVEYCHYSERCK